jgi:S1-C subfamily serine protease
MRNKILLIAAAIAALASEASYGLSTEEIVARSKFSVVAIIEEDTASGQYWKGTGWFITGNRIVTNEHVVNNPQPFDRFRIINLATKEEYTVDHLASADEATDVAVIVINGWNTSHLKSWPCCPLKSVALRHPLI